MSLDRRCKWLASLLLAAALALGALTLGDYGITFDEPARASSGEDWWRFIATFDPQYLPRGFMIHYGALFDMLGAALWHVHERFLGGRDEYAARHALVFLAGWLGWLGTYRLARRVAPEPVPLFALAILVLMPRYYGACFNNPKDVPFAAAAVWALYGLVRWLQEPRLGTTVLFGFLTATCIAVRPFGLLFVPLGLCAWIVNRRPRAALVREVGGYLLSALVFTVALWPILWVRPPWQLVSSVQAYGSRIAGSEHLYFGRVASITDSPRSYVAVWIAITAPLSTLLLFLVGAIDVIVRRKRLHSVTGALREWLLPGLLWLWVGLPMVVPVFRMVNLYSGVRHFLFLMPVIAILAAIGLSRVSTLRPRWMRAVFLSLVVLSYADVVREEVRLHPYESLYFSRIVGGIRGAERKFDVAHFGETEEEAFRWLADHHDRSGARSPARVHSIGGRLTADVPAYYAAKLGMILNGPVYEYSISEVRLGRDLHFQGEVLHTVSREGVRLAEVMKIDPMDAPGVAWARRQKLTAIEGFFDTSRLPAPRDGSSPEGTALSLTLRSPRDQTVSLYWGYFGAGTLRIRGAIDDPVAMQRVLRRSHPGYVRTEVRLRQGENVLDIDLSEIDLSRGLYLHYPRRYGLVASDMEPN